MNYFYTELVSESGLKLPAEVRQYEADNYMVVAFREFENADLFAMRMVWDADAGVWTAGYRDEVWTSNFVLPKDWMPPETILVRVPKKPQRT